MKLTRRNLLRLGSLAATGSLCWRFQPAMAGPFVNADFDKLVPADKKLSATWLRTLFERGEPEWSSGADLQHIGMPVRELPYPELKARLTAQGQVLILP